MELHAAKLKRTTADDYDNDYSDSDDEGAVTSKISKKNRALAQAAGVGGKKKVMGQLELLALGKGDETEGVESEKLAKDLKNMSKSQRMAIISSESPEIVGLYEDLQDKLEELHAKIMPCATALGEHLTVVRQSGEENNSRENDLVGYLEVKQQLLLSYCTNIMFYLLLKVEGKSVKNHPVMKQLLELRYAMDKMRPLDNKLKPQVDRLVKMGASGASDGASSLRPNPMALLGRGRKQQPNDSEEEENSDVEEAEAMADGSDGEYGEGSDEENENVYKPPKMSAVIFKENETAAQKADAKLAKQRKRLKNSEILDTLREEFGSAPESVSNTGLLGKTQEERRIEEDMDERRKFEEDRFVRLAVTKKDKQAAKRREREAMRGGMGADDLLVDIGDVDALDHMVQLQGRKMKESALDDSLGGSARSSKHQAMLDADSIAGGMGSKSLKFASKLLNKQTGDSGDEDSSAYGRMLRAGSGSGSGKGAVDDEYDFDYMDDGEGGGAEDDDGEGLLEEFAKRKRDRQQDKDELHNQHKQPRFAGADHNVEDGEKRKASYQILKNRGLTPHRKIANRNPRVKKREAYNKAVVARKGQVRETMAPTTAYDGERTGIKANISRSRRLI